MKYKMIQKFLLGALGVFLLLPNATFAGKKKGKSKATPVVSEKKIAATKVKNNDAEKTTSLKPTSSSNPSKLSATKKKPEKTKTGSKTKTSKGRKPDKESKRKKKKADKKEKEKKSEVLEGKKDASVTDSQLKEYKEVVENIEELRLKFLEPYQQAFFENRQKMSVPRFIDLKETGGELKKLDAIKATKEEIEIFTAIEGVHKKLAIQFKKLYKQLIEAKIGIMLYNLITKELRDNTDLLGKYEKLGKKDESEIQKKGKKKIRKKLTSNSRTIVTK